jgi:phenylacetate-CoA ligase
MRKEQLANLQRKQLRQILSYAYENVPFYHRAFDAAGISPTRIDEPRAIGRLPRVERGQFRSVTLGDRMSTHIHAASCRPITTSGSTGTPVKFLIDPFSAAWRDAINLRMLSAYGVKLTERVCRARGDPGPEKRSDFLDQPVEQQNLWRTLKNRHYRLLLFSGNSQEHLRFLQTWKPHVMIAASSYCWALIEACDVNNTPLHFKVIITTAELTASRMRTMIGKRFLALVYDNYALEESGPIAWECPSHSGYHVNSDSAVVELLRDGEPVSAGEPGEIHITAFHELATPLVRYATGDFATQLEDACPCGRGLPLIKEIQGRVFDFVSTPEGYHIPPTAIVGVLETVDGLEQFKVIQDSDFSVKVLLRAANARRSQVLADVENRCRFLLGDLPLKIQFVDSIDLYSQVKFRVVESSVRW